MNKPYFKSVISRPGQFIKMLGLGNKKVENHWFRLMYRFYAVWLGFELD